MGMFSMLNFIAASMATGAYSRILDHGSEVHFNPANLYPDGIIYSNIYLVLALMHAGVLVMYYFGFGSRKKANGLDNASTL
jgi:DHA2 family metal-tetracycline-proton antiporter-like MFS transporter